MKVETNSVHGGAIDASSHMFFNWFMAGLSIASNLLLVYLVKKVSVVAMGSYMILIYITAVMDVTIAISNAIVVPNIHMGKYSFVVFGVGTCHWPAVPGLVSIYVFDLLFYQTFALLSCHFLYRYVVLQKTSEFLTNLKVWYWASAGIVFQIFFNATMAFFISHYEPRKDWKPDRELVSDMWKFYGINMSRPFGHFHVVYAEMKGSSHTMSWNWPIVIYTLSILGLISALGVVMLACAFAVVKLMKQLASVSDSSSKANSTHQQFFRALVVQTVFPIVLSFTPVGFLVILPLTGRTFGALGNYLMSLSTVYPAVDPLLVIMCVQRYRRKLYSIVEVCIPPKYRTMVQVSGISMFTVTNKPSMSSGPTT